VSVCLRGNLKLYGQDALLNVIIVFKSRCLGFLSFGSTALWRNHVDTSALVFPVLSSWVGSV